MPGQRQDYLLTQIELLRQFVARLARASNRAGLEEALQLAFNLQEKLFAMPAADFLGLEVSGQIASLMAGESKPAGHEKCLRFAQLLKETATLYQFRGRDDLAAGARQHALHVALSVAVDESADPVAFVPLVAELQATLERGDLHPPVRELLDLFEARRKA